MFKYIAINVNNPSNPVYAYTFQELLDEVELHSSAFSNWQFYTLDPIQFPLGG